MAWKVPGGGGRCMERGKGPLPRTSSSPITCIIWPVKRFRIPQRIRFRAWLKWPFPRDVKNSVSDTSTGGNLQQQQQCAHQQQEEEEQ